MFIKKAFGDNKKSLVFLVSAIIFSLLFIAIIFFAGNTNQEKQVAKRFQENLINQIDNLDNKAVTIRSVLDADTLSLWPKLEHVVNQDNTLLLIYFGDSLIFWNNNKVSEDLRLIKYQKNQVINSNNGWYLLHYETYNNHSILLLKQVKSEYQYNNVILPSLVSDEFSNCQDISLTLTEEESGYPIFDNQERFVVGLNFEDYSPFSDQLILTLFLLFICIYYFVIEWLKRLYGSFVSFFKNDFLLIIFFATDLFFLRFLDYYFGFPAILKKSFLFEQNINSLAGFNSVGDLLLSSLLIFFVASRTYNYLKKQGFVSNNKDSKFTLIIWDILLLSIVYGLTFLINQAISGLPYDAFLGTKVNTITGVFNLVSILILAFALLYFGRAIGRKSLQHKYSFYSHFLVIITAAGLAYFLLNLQIQLLIVSLLFVLILYSVLHFVRESNNINFIKYLLLIILISATTAVIINRALFNTKNDHQVEIAEKLSTSSDIHLESSYFEFEKNVMQDTAFNRLVFSNDFQTELLLNEYIREAYFADYSMYDIQLTVCEKDEELEIQPAGLVVDCSEYFENLISELGEKKHSSSLYFIRGEPKSIYYVGKLVFNDLSESKANVNVFIEFYFTFIPEGLGYPELLIDNTLFEVDLSGYSYVRYKDNQLINKFGGFAYQTSYEYLQEYPDSEFFVFQGFRHYKIKLATGEYLIVSRQIEKMSIQLVTFSSLFIVFALILFIAFFLLYGKSAREVFQMSFQTRLQIIFISTISLIIVLLALITLYYVESSNKQKLVEQLTEKTNSVLIELDHKLSGEDNLDQFDPLTLEQLLRKFSLVFFSDINVYNTKGLLVASSRSEIFDRGLISDYINPMAFEELFVKNRLYYLTEESIGNVSYYSSYAPLILGSGQTAGIINLPYFARQSELTRSYYLMIFTFINSFVILGIVGAFLAILLSKIITRPLVVLQKSLADIQIDRQNERIDWNSDDEIGRLIAEYNQMIDKLEQSAELLKQSERESAWREVARQIAHEIKNPLTPMKLNVQYLEKAFSENDPNLDKKIKNISATLISQIDTLNKVAEMFSDFATSNVRNFEKVDLKKVIKESIQLFKNNPNVAITFKIDTTNKQWIILGYEKDLLRLFNNLIKNAIQALDNKQEGEINISLHEKNDDYLVQITDNGKGIPSDAKASIFKPYFTTKSGGTGLGLAIVKNIMNEIGGEISFESQSGKGTSFYLKIKSARQ